MTMMTMLIILASFIYCYEVEKIGKSVKLNTEKGRLRRASRYLLVMAWGVSVLIHYIPLPLCYAGFYLLLCVTELRRQNQKKSLYIVNIQFIYFAAIYLIVLGAMALVNRFDVNEVLLHPGFQGASLVLTMVIDAAGMHVIRRFIGNRKEAVFGYDRPEFWLLADSMWFWLAFVVADSIPTMFSLPADLVSLFLIGSNTLILFLLAFFHVHVYSITQNAYLEEEKIRLRIEDQEQGLRKAAMEKDAYIDRLTGAFTRSYAQKEITAMMEKDDFFSMVYIDLDSLKQINDERGHTQGDLHLKMFVGELKSQLRKQDVLSRVGGDEFLILMPACTEAEAERQMNALRERMEQDKEYRVSYSYGVVCVPAQGDRDIAEYLKEADRRMYEDKKARR